MGKCVRIRRGGSKPTTTPPPAASSCLTLRSGRRVPSSSPVACSPSTSGRPRRHRGSAALVRWCGAAKESACGSPRRRTTAAGAAGSAPAGRVQLGSRRLFHDNLPEEEEEEVPLRAAGTGADADAVACGVDGLGDSSERPTPPPMMTGDSDAAVEKAKAKHENESGCRGVVVVAGHQTPSQPLPPPTEAEIEAFFVAAELAERRRFAAAYNYDVALDVPLEGRFQWAPMST